MAKKTFRTGVFVSYSHKDKDWLEKLRTALAPLMRGEKLEVWDDTRIEPGANWAAEIKKSISRARVAILLVSPDFLASDYIESVELPVMLEQQADGLTILWIPIRPSLYERTPLKNIQAAHDPSKPLASLSRSKQDQVFVQIATRIATAADINAVANAFKIIDDFTPQLDAFVKGQSEPSASVVYTVVAKQEGEKITFESSSGPLEVIAAEDMDKLDADSQKLVRAYERTMKDLFERWVELKPKRVSRDPEIKKEAIEESNDVRRDLCEQLGELLNFIESMGKSLQDHYNHIRFICQR
jgi:hypothetical protein